MLAKLVRSLLRPGNRLLLSPAVRNSNAFYALQNRVQYEPRESLLQILMEFAAWSQLEGDYLEFGVFQGRTFVTAYHTARRMGLRHMRFYAFDSFQGLPEVGGVDAAGFQQFQQGEYASSLETFKSALREGRVAPAAVTVVPGWFNESLPRAAGKLPLRQAAVAWIDCDLYESTVPVLEFLTPHLQDGTVLVFDDWFCFRGHPERGQQKAFNEWLQAHPRWRATEFHLFSWHGQSFILNEMSS